MKNIISKLLMFIIVLGVIFTLGTICFTKNNKDSLYQVATISSLLEGVYDSDVGLEGIINKNSLGIGTFNSLDGEMILLDGVLYKAKSDGKIYLMPKNVKTPFASFVDFSCEQKFNIENVQTFNQLKTVIDRNLHLVNSLYAFKIEGDFDFIKVRSVPKQKKPYLPLVEVAKKQAVFVKENIKGTIVGFKLPDFMKGLNVPGYHFHFISSDKSFGGHILDLRASFLKVEADRKNEFLLHLPNNLAFQKAKIEIDNKDEQLQQVER